MHNHRAALNVAQKLQAQALAFTGARDQPGHIRNGVAVRAGLNHTQVWYQSGEGIVGNLGARRAHGGNQGGFTGAGVTH